MCWLSRESCEARAHGHRVTGRIPIVTPGTKETRGCAKTSSPHSKNSNGSWLVLERPCSMHASRYMRPLTPSNGRSGCATSCGGVVSRQAARMKTEVATTADGFSDGPYRPRMRRSLASTLHSSTSERCQCATCFRSDMLAVCTFSASGGATCDPS
jgi:hypothetical protein